MSHGPEASGGGGGGGIGRKVLDFGKERLVTTPIRSGKGLVTGTIGGLADATAMNVGATMGDLFQESHHAPMPAMQAVGELVTQPLVRVAKAGKDLVTLRPLAAAAQLGAGAVEAGASAVDVVRGIANTTANAAKRALRGGGRAAIAAATLGEDVAVQPKYATEKKTREVKIVTGFGSNQPPAGEHPTFGHSAGATN